MAAALTYAIGCSSMITLEHCARLQHEDGLSEKYNVGGRNERRNVDGDAYMRSDGPIAITGERYDNLIVNVTDRPGHDARYAIDASKLENELGWKATENFDSGIRKTVRWYLENEWWWRPLRDSVYAGQRLGIVAATA